MSTNSSYVTTGIGTLQRGQWFRETDEDQDGDRYPVGKSHEITLTPVPCTVKVECVHIQVDGSRSWCIHVETPVVQSVGRVKFQPKAA